MSAEAKRTLESLVAALDEASRHGHSVEAVTNTWRFAGIVDPSEVRAWLDVGVFDGHRAGILRLAGIGPGDLAAIPEGRRLGLDFAIGKLSVAEIANLVIVLTAAKDDPGSEGKSSFVRSKKRDAEPDDR